MTFVEARRHYADQLWSHTWAFARRPREYDRTTRWRDDLLTDARDTLHTIRDKETP
jgi:hypothetical protein